LVLLIGEQREYRGSLFAAETVVEVGARFGVLDLHCDL